MSNTNLIITLLDRLEDCRDEQCNVYESYFEAGHPNDCRCEHCLDHIASVNDADNEVILVLAELDEAGYDFPKYEPTAYVCDEAAPF